MADQEFLASFGVDIDENGVSRLQQILTENQTLAKSLSDSFNAASESVKAFQEQVAQDLPSLFSGSGYGKVTENLFGSAGGLKIGLNMTEPKKEIASFTADAKKPILLSANGSGIVSAARTALENVRSLFSETFTINVRASTSTDNAEEKKDSRTDSRNRDDTGSTFLRMSTGGRFTRPTDVQVAEDGDAEYIIPVKKENQALPLVRQMLGEMSPEARQSLTGPEQRAETETQDAPSSLTVISPDTEDKPEPSPVPDLRQVLSEADRPLPAVPATEKEESPETNISVSIPSIHETFAEEDSPIANAPIAEKQETSEKEITAPVPVVRETFEEADHPLTAVPVTEKEESPEENGPAPIPVIRETLAEADYPLPVSPATEKETSSENDALAPILAIRETFAEEDRPFPTAPATVKEESSEENGPAPIPAIREALTEVDHPLATVPASEKTETQESVASVPVPASRPEEKPADQAIDVSALLKELSETGNEGSSTQQPNIATASAEKEAAPKLFAPASNSVEKESAPQLSAPIPASTEQESAPQLSVPVSIPTEKEPVLQFPAPLPVPAEKEIIQQFSVPIQTPAEKEPAPQISVPAPVDKEPVSQLSASAPVSVSKEDFSSFSAYTPLPIDREMFAETDLQAASVPSVENKETQEAVAPAFIPPVRNVSAETDYPLAPAPMPEKEEKQDAVSPVTLPPIREIFSESDHPLAPAPAAKTESLSSAATSSKQDFSDMISRLSSMIQPSGNTVTNTSNNLSAPVTINVKATGSDAEQIGETIYNTAERYLLRTMKSAFQY